MVDAFDVVVIGSGAGGASVAAIAAERGRTVAVIEAGTAVRPASAEIALERHYLGGGYLAAVGEGLIPVLAGRALGGTTPINSGTCFPPPPELLAQWDLQFGTTWARDLPAHVSAVERAIHVNTPDAALLGPSHLLFAEGMRAMGYPDPVVLPRNSEGCDGGGMCCFGCPGGRKQSADVAWLPRARNSGAEIFSSTTATSITVQPTGVRVGLSGSRNSPILARKLVLSGGALGTPRLVRENRLGSHWHAAGRGLSIHPATKVVAAFSHPVHGDRGIPQGTGLRLPELPGVLFEGIFTPPEVLLPLLLSTGADPAWWLDRHDHLASHGLMVRDHGRGSVRTVGGEPFLRYDLDPRDRRSLLEGARLIGRAFFRAGAVRVLMPLFGYPHGFRSEAELDAVDLASIPASRVVAMGFHPLGTVGLGRLVDAELRLVGTDNVFVCDGSVLPEPLGVNPQVTIMSLGHWLGSRL